MKLPNSQKGFAPIILIIILLVIFVAGSIGYYIFSKTSENKIAKQDSETLRENQADNQNKQIPEDSLIGIWQDMPSLGSGWSDRYQFYKSKTYAHIASQFDCANRNLGEVGTWNLAGSKLVLTSKKRVELTGGKLVDSAGSCGSPKMIEGSTEQVVEVNGESRELNLSPRQKTDDEVYPSFFFNDQPYWRFNDELKDNPFLKDLGLSGCGSDQDPCI